jgi:nitroreductase
MDFFGVVETRESIRNYDSDKPIEEGKLQRILEAGRLAPSAANRQPWQFILVSSKQGLERVRPCYDADWFRAAPHILIVKGKAADAWTRADGYNSLETDLTIAMDHLILAAENEGVGTCWIANFKPDVLRAVLDLSDDESVFAITPLGYQTKGFKKKGRKSRKSLEEIVLKL